MTPIVVDPQHPHVAHASFRYICVSTVAAPHLFVAAKQGPFINTSTRSSSDWARAFYSTNWRSDKAPNALTCDGAAHRALLTLLPDAGFTAHRGLQALQTGKQAFLQICLFDDSGHPAGGRPAFRFRQGSGHPRRTKRVCRNDCWRSRLP